MNTLADIRNKLIRLEDTIIFAMIERAQYKQNSPIYGQDLAGMASGGLPLVDYALYETEKINARAGRYMGLIDVPFFDDLPGAALFIPKLAEFPVQHNNVNLNERIRLIYSDEIIPFLCEPGDDQRYWESCVSDVQCLQAFSQRVHYGKVVAEIKLQQHGEKLRQAVLNNDKDKVFDMITDAHVEQKVIERILQKAMYYGHFPDGKEEKIKPQVVLDAYQRWVIPMTKEVECGYLFEVICQEN